MSASQSARFARMKSVVAMSFGFTLALAIAVVAFVAIGGETAEAATCTLTSTAAVTNWSDPTKWSGCSGTYPGAVAGDTASIGLSGFTMNVDVSVPNPVVVQVSGFASTQIPALGRLILAAGSTGNSGAPFTVTGGTMGTASGANIASFGSGISVNSGNFNSLGTLNMGSSSSFSLNGGTLDGSGTISLGSFSSFSISGSSGAMTIDGTTISNPSGSINYTSSTNSLSLINGANINNSGTGTFSLSGSAAINTDGTGFITNSATMSRSVAGTSTINARVDNSGTVSAGSGTLELLGGGTHSGTFDISSSSASLLRFSGTHAFNSGSTLAASPLGGFEITGGTFAVNTAMSIPTIKQTGGTLTGSAALTVNTKYDWAGGDQSATGSGSTQMGGSSQFLIDPTTLVTLGGGRTINSSGTMAYAPTGAGQLMMANAAAITVSGGSFDLKSDTTILADATSPHIDVVGGTLTKSAGTKTIVNPVLNINGNGTIQPVNRTISFGGGGSIGGVSITVDTSTVGSTVDFSGGTTFLTGNTTYTGGGNLSLTNTGTLSVGAATSVSTFTQSGSSTLAGNSTLSVGTYNWTGGSMNGGGTGTGTVSIINTMNINGAATRIYNHYTLTNGGTVNYSPTAALAVDIGGQIVNNGTFNLQNSTGITSDLATFLASPKFTNNGTLAKSGGGTTAIGVPVASTSSISTTGGTLRFAGGGTNSGSIAINLGTDRVEVSTLTFALNSGTSFSAAGVFGVMSGGTLSVSTPVSIPKFEVNAGANVSASTAITVGTNFKWTGGTLSGTNGQLINNGLADATSLTGAPTLKSGFKIVNNATFNYNPNFNLTFDATGGGTTFQNVSPGVFNITGNGTTSVSGVGNIFINTGTVNKTSGAGGFTFTVPFTNNTPGIVDDQDPTSAIAFNAAGSQINGGTVKASNATATIDFTGGSMAMSAGSFAGPGPIQLKGAILDISTTPQIFPPIFNMSSGSIQGNAGIQIPSGGVFNWSGGSITGSNGQAVETLSGGTFNADSTTSSLIYDTRPFIVDPSANFTWNSGANSLIFQNGTILSNNGTMSVNSNGTIGTSAVNPGTFSNFGLLHHTNTGTLNLTIPTSNTGTIRDSQGITFLSSTAGVTHTGNFDALSPGLIAWGAGTQVLGPGATLTGNGTFKVSGAQLDINTNVTAQNFIVFAGTLTGASNLTTTNSFSWSGGQMAGSGTTIVSGGTASFTAGPLTLQRNLTLGINTTFNAASGMTVQNGITITNNATFDLQSGNISCVCTPIPSTFVNNGTLQRSSASNVTFAVPVTGAGTLNLMTGGGIFTENADGAFSSATVNGWWALGGNFTVGTISGASAVQLVSGSLTVSGAMNVNTGAEALFISSGTTATLNGASSLSGISMSGGTLTGTGNISVSKVTSIMGGTISGSGTLTNTSITLPFSLSGAGITISRNIINNGALANFGNGVSLSPGVVVTNNGTFGFAGTSVSALAGSPTPVFNNVSGATFSRQGSGLGTFDPIFNNAGTFNQSAGASITFTNGFNQTAGSSTFTVAANSPPGFNFNGGNVAVATTLTGNVSNGGATIAPSNGIGPAAATISGNYTQAAAGTLKTNINGVTPGTQYGQLNVSGNVNLNGTFTVVNPLGYTPSNGDTYNVLTFTGTRTGDFTTYNLPPPGPVGFLQTAYIVGPPAALQITAITQTVDVGVTQSGPGSVNQTQNATIVVTIGNSGPSTASGVVLNDTFSGGTFVSATPSTGSCSGSGPVTCNIGTIASGNSATVTLVLNANAAGTITNNANATTTTFDTNTANNNAPALNVTVNPSVDLSLTQSAPASISQGSNVTIVATISNAGPNTAASAGFNTTLSGGAFVSATPSIGSCTGTTSLTCNFGNLASGASATVSIVMNGNVAGTITSNGNATTTTFDLNTANNANTTNVIVGPNADLQVTKTGPVKATPNGNITYTIVVSNPGPSAAPNVTLTDPTPAGLTFLSASGGGCGAFPCNLGTMNVGQSVTVTAIYAIASPNATSFTNVATVSSTMADPNTANNSSTFVTVLNCPSPAALVAPVNGVLVNSPVHFAWTGVAGATSYEVFVSNGNAPAASVGTTSTTQLDAPVVGDGTMTWYVVANVGGCGPLQSGNATFTICSGVAAPQPSVIAQTASGQTYTVQWDAVPGATKYEVDEAPDASFAGATTTSTTSTSVPFTHSATQAAQTFFYRVRAFSGCTQQFGAYSAPALRVIIVPLPAKTDPSPNVNVPAGSKQVVVQQLFIPGIDGGNFTFAATADEPWVTVNPSTGILTPAGVTLTLTTDPSTLPNGTFTSTIIVTLNPVAASGSARPEVTTVVSVPVSISLVTPVQPGGKSTPPANALIFPAVGHLDGIDSHWQSDIRVSNTSNIKQSYLLSFTPSDPTQPVKSTTINIDGGATTALDDIVKNWYGLGTVGDAGSGVLEIHPVDSSGRPITTQSLATVASSRTYNVAASGTLGQFIPAIPFNAFVGKAANNAAGTILSLQQIAQSAAYRTNFGVIEGSGKPATVLMSIFDDSGKNLKDVELNLAAFEQKQLNSFLSAQNITLNDGRVSVKVTGGDGKISTFASVVDNATQDPLLVTGIPLGQTTSSRYVLPGVADISNGFANWRTDMRVFNASDIRQNATFTFFPLGAGSDAKTLTAQTQLEPGEVKTFDNIMKSLFGVSNTGGALHVTTPSTAALVVSGRTYNQTDTGTYGQFVGAVTAADAVGAADRTLQILQVEDSPRYRTNIGIAEVTGQAATVEMSIILPDSRVTPKLTIPLAANEYRQFSPAVEMGLGNIYNARVAIRVTSGIGKVTAYGSVIDMKTQDPTYVPAQ